jgi:predicted metal-binding protein
MFSISVNVECLREKNVLYFSQCWMLEREKCSCSLFQSMLNAWRKKMFSISVNVECLFFSLKHSTLIEIENIFLSQAFNIDWNREHLEKCSLFQSMLNAWERKMFSISVNVECLREKTVLYFSQCWMLEREKCSLREHFSLSSIQHWLK